MSTETNTEETPPPETTSAVATAVPGASAVFNAKELKKAVAICSKMAAKGAMGPMWSYKKTVVVTVNANHTASVSLCTGEWMITMPLRQVDVHVPGELRLMLPAGKVMLDKVKGEAVQLRDFGDQVQIVDESAMNVLVKPQWPDEGLPLWMLKQEPWEGDQTITVGGEDYQRGMKRTVFAADTESTRYALGGVMFDMGERCLTLAATDTRRLAIEVLPGVGKLPDKDFDIREGRREGVDKEIIVATENVIPKQVSQVSGEIASGIVKIVIGKNLATITSDAGVIVTKLIEGRFPRYQDVIPTKANWSTRFDSVAMLDATTGIIPNTDDENRGVDFVFDKSSVKIKAVNGGEQRCRLNDASGIVGFTMTLDPKYIAEYCRNLGKGVDVEMNIIDAECAVLMTAGAGFYVVMPLSRDR